MKPDLAVRPRTNWTPWPSWPPPATYKQTVLKSFGQVADTLTALENDAQSVDRQREASMEGQTETLLVKYRKLVEDYFRAAAVAGNDR